MEHGTINTVTSVYSEQYRIFAEKKELKVQFTRQRQQQQVRKEKQSVRHLMFTLINQNVL